MDKNSKLHDHIRSHGLRATKQRILVLQNFLSSQKPLTTPELEMVLKGHNIDRVTIYRMVRDFEKVGLLRRLDFRDGAVRYEMIDQHNKHHHIVCISCGIFEDVHICDDHIDTTKVVKDSKQFTVLIDHAFEIFALCAHCSQQID